MSNINQREVAVYALMDITQNGGYNNIVLRKTLSRNGAMTPVEKAFVTELVNGCLRNLIFLDYAINRFSKTATDKMKPFILNLLRVGAYQLLFMDKVPESAACNESVKLAKQKSFSGLAPFVNGVLRNMQRQKNDIPVPDKDATPVSHLSVRYAYPEWLIEDWLAEMDFDTLEKMLQANNRKPRVTICVNTLKTDVKSLTDMLVEADVVVEPCDTMSDALFVSHTSDITALEAFRQGLFHVMDQGAMLAVKLMNPVRGATVLDVCAAPGGKSFYTAYLMQNEGNLFSFDKYEHKIKLMDDMAERLGISIMTAKAGDATVLHQSLEHTADFVLVDAPCSGLGLIGKKPDIKLTKSRADIGALSLLQRDILTTCQHYVKPGGVLLYSTCTISKKENLDNIIWFTKKFNFQLENVVDLLPNMLQSETASCGYLQLLPQMYGGDGFFIAKLRKG